MHQAGLLDRAFRNAKQRAGIKNPCSIYGKSSQGEKQNQELIALKLSDVSGLFCVLGMCIGSAILVLIAEFIINKA